MASSNLTFDAIEVVQDDERSATPPTNRGIVPGMQKKKFCQMSMAFFIFLTFSLFFRGEN